MEVTPRQREEQQIIHRILGGDTALFAILVERYQRPVQALVFRIVGDGADADELTQDCFLKAFQSLVRFRGTSAFSTWLFRITYNTAVSAVRKPRREVRGIDEQRLNSVSDEEADALFASESEARVEALIRAIARLNPSEQSLLHLFYEDGQSIEVCAEIVGLSVSNVKVRLHRIRKKLYLLMVGENGTYDK